MRTYNSAMLPSFHVASFAHRPESHGPNDWKRGGKGFLRIERRAHNSDKTVKRFPTPRYSHRMDLSVAGATTADETGLVVRSCPLLRALI